MTPELNFIFLHGSHIGYGQQGVETFRALKGLGLGVYDGLPGSGDLDLHKKKSRICKDVVYLSTPTHIPGWYENQRKHLFTMWETMQLPELLREPLQHFDTILTPSLHCVDMYSRFHPNVKYVPLGVDGKRWAFRERRGGAFFDFLVAGGGIRKGADLVHRAFLELSEEGSFDGPVARLYIKSPTYQDFFGPNVFSINGWMTADDETELYAQAHCFVQPSRGEGWGLQPLQAMAQGCPTILTGAHGHRAFSRYGMPINSRPAPAEKMNLFGDSGDWWEPDYEHLKRAMKHVYDNYAFHRDRARDNSSIVRTKFTWQKSALALLDGIGYDRLCESFEDSPGEWVTPSAETFRVEVNRDYRVDLGGTTRLFEPGTTYQLRADLKRLFFEMNVLSPVSGPEGLSATQLNRWDDYVADQEVFA